VFHGLYGVAQLTTPGHWYQQIRVMRFEDPTVNAEVNAAEFLFKYPNRADKNRGLEDDPSTPT
jgi:hypothetical protein